MQFLLNTWYTILDALFPSSSFVQSVSPEETWRILPRAPISPIPDTYSIFAYKDARVKQVVWNIKYKKSPKATTIGGYALSRVISEKFPTVEPAHNHQSQKRNVVIIPMPITDKRRRERGFNQCELLANAMKLCTSTESPLEEGRGIFQIEKDLLVRIHHASRQTLKNRKERLISAKGIFALNENAVKKYLISSTNDGGMNMTTGDNQKNTFVIIDDVITTGSTMKEAMVTMKNGGFANVYGVSLAH